MKPKGKLPPNSLFVIFLQISKFSKNFKRTESNIPIEKYEK